MRTIYAHQARKTHLRTDSHFPFNPIAKAGFVPHNSRPFAHAREHARMPDNKIYLSNLNKLATEADLKRHFSTYGAVTEVHLPREKKTKEAKGYAFVTFAYEDSARRALEQDGKPYMDQTITVQIAIEKNPRK
ncbi:MAG: RNA-binding protein [Gammaproteobacteria bacterium]|nr:RNA-binding protein [Gammaproteobacteria bacterium]